MCCLMSKVIVFVLDSMEDGGADEENRAVKKFRMGKLCLLSPLQIRRWRKVSQP